MASRHRGIEARIRLARAFSLVEILVAVIVLGLGLLGLAALFPVVIREQRIGTENVTGVLVSNGARATLRSMDWDQAASGAGAPSNAWAALRASTHANGLGADTEDNNLGRWVVPEVRTTTTSFYNAGSTMFGEPATHNGRVGIQLASRLYPTQGDPQFVWDIAVQRVSDFNLATGYEFDALRCAVFVRRIDQRIRVPNGETLRSVLVSPVSAINRRLPIGENGQGLPTGDGTGGGAMLRYGTLKTVNISNRSVIRAIRRAEGDNAGPGTALVVSGQTPLGAMIAQAGQKLVDNLGNIYTVTRVATEEGVNPDFFRCDLSPQIPEQAFLQPMTLSGGALRPASLEYPRLRQFVFAPQVPAAVVLTEVYP